MMSYTHAGMRTFLDAEAQRLGLGAEVVGSKQWALASGVRPLREIDNHLANCGHVPALATEEAVTAVRAETLGHCEMMVSALMVSLLGGIRIVESIYRGFEIEVPEWVSLDLLDVHPSPKSPPKRARKPRGANPPTEQPEDTQPSPDYFRVGIMPYLEAEANRLGITDTPENMRPVAIASRAHALGEIGKIATQCLEVPPAARGEILGRCETSIAVLALSVLAGVRALEAAYQGYGLEVPEWASLSLLTKGPALV